MEKLLIKACVAKPGHTRFLDNRRLMPVVVSSKRYDDILGRATMAKKHANLAAEEEERRYMQYLKDGSDYLCSFFTNMGPPSIDEEKQAKLEQELKEAAIREAQVRLEDEQLRLERVMRATRILENLKAGQRALHHALLESEVARQRRFDQEINKEIAEAARLQEEQDEKQCPMNLIPFQFVTEEQEKEVQAAKAQVFRTDMLQDIEERRQRRLAEKEQEVIDVIIERAMYQCLHDKEKKEAKERAERSREFCRRAYKDALKEKAEKAKYEEICDTIDDRVVCVDTVKNRNLSKKSAEEVKDLRAKRTRLKENTILQLKHIKEEKQRKDQELEDKLLDEHEFFLEADAACRQAEVERLSKERRAYELEDRKQAELRRQREAEIQRFKVAERFKNEEANKHFKTSSDLKKKKATAKLRAMLYGQRDEFLERQRQEKMRMSSCQADPFLQSDVQFFKDAYKTMVKSRKVGRPLFPIAKAVEIYKRDNQIDSKPEGRRVCRSKIRDYCWPGYHSKADLAYRNYEHRDNCLQETEKERNSIFANCIKITKMAAEEQPYKKCEIECPIKCFRHRGVPAINSVDSFDVGSNAYHVCDPKPPIPPACPSPMQLVMRKEGDRTIVEDVVPKNLVINAKDQYMPLPKVNRQAGGKSSFVPSPVTQSNRPAVARQLSNALYSWR